MREEDDDDEEEEGEGEHRADLLVEGLAYKKKMSNKKKCFSYF